MEFKAFPKIEQLIKRSEEDIQKEKEKVLKLRNEIRELQDFLK